MEKLIRIFKISLSGCLFSRPGRPSFTGRRPALPWMLVLAVVTYSNFLSLITGKLPAFAEWPVWYALVPGIAAYESFSVFFDGSDITAQWIIVVCVLVVCMAQMRFWCHNFCLVGAILNFTAQIRRRITKKRVEAAERENRERDHHRQGHRGRRVEYNLSVAAEWLTACGQDASFSYIQQGCQGKQKKKLLAIETGLKVTSRRDLFVSLFNKGQQIAGKASGGKNTFPEELDSTMRNSCLPNWQRRLAEEFEKNRKDSSDSAYWPSIKIDSDRCVNCGMCSRFCPSGTLQITVKDGICNHHFTSGLCLDCRTCQLFCPREAISRGREKVERPFETASIYKTLTGSCQNCESTTAHHAKTLCYWCEEATATDNELKNSFRKIFLGMSG